MSGRLITHKLFSWVAVFATLGLVSCASLFTPEPELSMNSVSIYAELDANENSATAVDLVLVYNQDLIHTLSQLSASKYFETSKQLLLDNPGLLDIWHWELVPGQIVEKFKPFQPKGEAFAAFVFANYLTPGAHRLKVPCNGVVTVLLLRTDLRSVSTTPCGRDRNQGSTMSIPGGESGECYDEMCTVRQAPSGGPCAVPCAGGAPIALTPHPGGKVVVLQGHTPTVSQPCARQPVAIQPLPPIGASQ